MHKKIVFCLVLLVLLLSGCIIFPTEEVEPFSDSGIPEEEPSLTGNEPMVDGLIKIDVNLEEKSWITTNVSEEALERSESLDLSRVKTITFTPLIGGQQQSTGQAQINVSYLDVNTARLDYSIAAADGTVTGSYEMDIGYNYRLTTPYNLTDESRGAVWFSRILYTDLVDYTSTEGLLEWRVKPEWFAQLEKDYVYEGTDYFIRAHREAEGLSLTINGVNQEVQCIRATDSVQNEYWILDNKDNPLILKLQFNAVSAQGVGPLTLDVLGQHAGFQVTALETR